MSTRSFEVAFLALSTIGFILLWPMMIYNGTLVGLLKAAWNGSFADGSALLTRYTYIWPIDFAISVLVAFFDGQIDGKDNGTWILMFDLLAVLQTAALWVIIEGSRKSNSKTILRLYVLLKRCLVTGKQIQLIRIPSDSQCGPFFGICLERHSSSRCTSIITPKSRTHPQPTPPCPKLEQEH
jgi:hypothetical protein